MINEWISCFTSYPSNSDKRKEDSRWFKVWRAKILPKLEKDEFKKVSASAERSLASNRLWNLVRKLIAREKSRDDVKKMCIATPTTTKASRDNLYDYLIIANAGLSFDRRSHHYSACREGRRESLPSADLISQIFFSSLSQMCPSPLDPN